MKKLASHSLNFIVNAKKSPNNIDYDKFDAQSTRTACYLNVSLFDFYSKITDSDFLIVLNVPIYSH